MAVGVSDIPVEHGFSQLDIQWCLLVLHGSVGHLVAHVMDHHRPMRPSKIIFAHGTFRRLPVPGKNLLWFVCLPWHFHTAIPTATRFVRDQWLVPSDHPSAADIGIHDLGIRNKLPLF